jgi:HEAT repeat protein
MRDLPTSALLLLIGFRIAVAQTPASAPPAAKSTTTSPASNADRARGLLDDSLKDRNPDTRKQAVQSLSLAGAQEPYLSMLVAMLPDKDVQVRVATVASLGDLKSPTTVPALQKVLNEDVPEVSFAAAKALWTLGEPSGQEALLSILSGETKTSSGFLTQQKRDALRMLYTPKTLFMFAVKTGAAFAPVPGLGTGVSSLQGILSDPSVSGRAATALLLSTDKDPKVLDALKDALGDKDASVRSAAAHAIALRNDPALSNTLIPLFEDKKEAVRDRAAAGYLRLEWIKATAPKPASKTLTKRTPKKAAPAAGASKK